MQRYVKPFGWILLVAVVGAGCILIGMRLADQMLARASGFFAAPWTSEAAFTAAIFLPMLLIATPMALRLRKGARAGRPVQDALLGAAIGMGGLCCAAGLAALAGCVVRGSAASGPMLLLVTGAAVTLVQAGGEEVLLRGWLQAQLRRNWPIAPAVIAASLVFMALHLLGGARSPLALANLFLGGVLFGLLAERTGGLAAPIVAHWTWNATETLLLGLSPNPGTGAFGAAIDLDLIGQPRWGGTDQGLNASIALSFTLAALVLPLAVWRGRQHRGEGRMRRAEPPIAAAPRATARATAEHRFFLGDEGGN